MASTASTVATIDADDETPPQKVDGSIYERMELSKVIGSGTFGTVYRCSVPGGKDHVAVKAVLQDPKFKNRELDILRMLNNKRRHQHIVELKHYFYRKDRAGDKYLYIVMGYQPFDIARLIRHYSETRRTVPILYTKLYMYQLLRALAFLHSQKVCHRDLKPSNILFDPECNLVQICDLGSAKVLVEGQPNVSYIASRYYRAPELIFESTMYTTAIDMWSFGCILAEMLIGEPFFVGESSVDQLVEIISVLGTPSFEELHEMNPEHRQSISSKSLQPHNIKQFMGDEVPGSAVELLEMLLVYRPSERPVALHALQSSFFDDLRRSDFVMPSNGKFPPLFNFCAQELAVDQDAVKQLIPPHGRESGRRVIATAS